MLASSSIDLVTVAQAFHWFDEDAALAEFKRILKPQGQLALIWNRRDLSDPFQRAYENMLLELAPDYNAVNHMSIKDTHLEALFDNQSYQQKTYPYLQSFDCEQFPGRMQSSSYVPAKASRERSELKRAAVTLFDKFAENGRLKFLYSSHLYLGRPALIHKNGF
jgi:SAM-dependent methyltransferase